jgi:hypothetical protein
MSYLQMGEPGLYVVVNDSDFARVKWKEQDIDEGRAPSRRSLASRTSEQITCGF